MKCENVRLRQGSEKNCLLQVQYLPSKIIFGQNHFLLDHIWVQDNVYQIFIPFFFFESLPTHSTGTLPDCQLRPRHDEDKNL
jgi:hypothetical protein